MSYSRVSRLLCVLGLSVVVCLTLTSCQSSQPPVLPTVQYDDPFRPIPLATRGRADVQQLIRFFTQTNPQPDLDQLNKVARAYIDEAAIEGVNSDIAFCQMCLETNYLRFGGDVKPWQNNFCGLGATGNGEPGATFFSIEVGVRAHIQHLKAYANAQPLRQKCVDPRFGLVPRATAPYVEDLTKKWATDPEYDSKIKRKLQALEKLL